MYPQQQLSVIIIIILIVHSLEIHGGVVDKSRVSKSSIVHRNVNSMTVSTKINSGLPLIPLHSVQQSKTHSILQNIQEPTKIKRQGKFFSDLSFLTGLGIGSLAHSAIIPPGIKSPSIVPGSEQQLPQAFMASQNNPNFYDVSNPYHVSLSTNNLLNQALKSMQEVLGQLKTQFGSKEMSNIRSSSPSSLINDKHITDLNNETSDEVNERDETEVRVFKKNDEQMSIFNCSALKDIIRETIKEQNIGNGQRQAAPPDMDSTTESSDTTVMTTDMTISTTSTTPASTTQMSKPKLNTTTENSIYYSGIPHNLSGINLINSYPPSSYGYPQPIQNIYGPPPPIYSSEPFPHHYHHPQEYYHHETVEEYPPDSTINSGNHFSSVSDQWPIYPPYTRAQKFLHSDNAKLINTGNGFIPSNKIG